MVMKAIYVILFLIFAPFIGGLLDGMDRKLSARMQGRTGPSVLQPFYDLWRASKEDFEAFLYYADRLAAHIEKGKEWNHDHEIL